MRLQGRYGQQRVRKLQHGTGEFNGIEGETLHHGMRHRCLNTWIIGTKPVKDACGNAGRQGKDQHRHQNVSPAEPPGFPRIGTSPHPRSRINDHDGKSSYHTRTSAPRRRKVARIRPILRAGGPGGPETGVEEGGALLKGSMSPIPISS